MRGSNGQSWQFLLNGKVTSGHQHHLHACHLLKFGCHQTPIDAPNGTRIPNGPLPDPLLPSWLPRLSEYQLEPTRKVRGVMGDPAYQVGGVCGPQKARNFWLEQEVALRWSWKRPNPTLFKGTSQKPFETEAERARDNGNAVADTRRNAGMGVTGTAGSQHVLGEHHLHDRASISCLNGEHHLHDRASMSCLHGATTSTRGVQGRAGMLHVLGDHHLPARALEHALGDHRLPTWPSEQLLGKLHLQVQEESASEHGVGPHEDRAWRDKVKV